MHGAPVPADLPVADTLEHFDPNAGSRLERLVFNNRRLVIVACALLTVLLGAVAVIKLSLGASFEKMIRRVIRTSRTTSSTALTCARSAIHCASLSKTRKAISTIRNT